METRCISMEAKLEGKTKECQNLKIDCEKLEKEKKYLERKAAEKDQKFHEKCNRLWELCKNCYDKFGAKPEDACWELGSLILSLVDSVVSMKIYLLFCRQLLI